ncbi:hypothetical protein D3C81_830280 [compost metagenome]
MLVRVVVHRCSELDQRARREDLVQHVRLNARVDFDKPSTVFHVLHELPLLASELPVDVLVGRVHRQATDTVIAILNRCNSNLVQWVGCL